MLEQVLKYLRNWFCVSVHTGNYSVVGGGLELDFLRPGQYFRVVGSVFNDGVYQYPAELKDEAFYGSVWALAVPSAVLDLATEIEAWSKEYANRINSPYQSESFGGYSYTLKNAYSPKGGSASVSWENVFSSRLNAWRKM